MLPTHDASDLVRTALLPGDLPVNENNASIDRWPDLPPQGDSDIDRGDATVRIVYIKEKMVSGPSSKDLLAKRIAGLDRQPKASLRRRPFPA